MFSTLLRRWIGNEIDEIPISEPFYYAVHRDSLVAVEEVEQHLPATHDIALEQGANTACEYFGSDYRMPPERLSNAECEALFDRRLVLVAWRPREYLATRGDELMIPTNLCKWARSVFQKDARC